MNEVMDDPDTVTQRGVTDVKRSDDSPQFNFKTLIVIELSARTTDTSVEWFKGKLEAPRRFGGAELIVVELKDKHREERLLHVTAGDERLLEAAELMELKKPLREGGLRELCVAELQDFRNSDDAGRILTEAEKQRVALHEMELLRAGEADTHLPGSSVTFYHGEALIPKLRQDGVIVNLFPLHDKEKLRELSRDWVFKPFSPQPIADIQEYFGDTVAMYFAFLGNYTMALIPPALIGFMSALMVGYDNSNLMIFFSVFNLIWATLFLEKWKRNCSTLAYTWGTINTEPFEEARAEYHGVLGKNQITGRLEPQYPAWQRACKLYLVAMPTVFLCVGVAFVVMLGYFWMQDLADSFHALHEGTLSSLLTFVPSVVYAVVIAVMNMGYRPLAKALTDWENHRLQSSYDNHLITKLVMFDFSNCFMSLFYVAFYLKNICLLRQILNQVMESGLPYMLYKMRKSQIKSRLEDGEKSGVERCPSVEAVGRYDVSTEDKLQGAIESSKEEFVGTMDDYLEMSLQFGYVFLFSSVFPTAAFYALANNITEIRSDAFKLCRIFQRPFAQPTASIGAWQTVFEIMSVMAVITNCALVALTPQAQELMPSYGEVNVLMLIVLVEHVLLFTKQALAHLIPDAPLWVDVALARRDYQAKQAWRAQRSAETLKHREAKLLAAQNENSQVEGEDAQHE